MFGDVYSTVGLCALTCYLGWEGHRHRHLLKQLYELSNGAMTYKIEAMTRPKVAAPVVRKKMARPNQSKTRTSGAVSGAPVTTADSTGASTAGSGAGDTAASGGT